MPFYDQTGTVKKQRVGTVKRHVTGTEFTYVKAGAAIAAFDACRVTGTLESVVPTSAAGQVVVGVAQNAIASGAYGWIATKGACTCKVVAATAIGSPLVTNATAGTLALGDATAIAAPCGTPTVVGVAAGSTILLT